MAKPVYYPDPLFYPPTIKNHKENFDPKTNTIKKKMSDSSQPSAIIMKSDLFVMRRRGQIPDQNYIKTKNVA